MPNPQPQPQPQTQPRTPTAGPQTTRPGGGQSPAPQPPGAPGGGGGLSQPLFSGDHVLEAVARGQGALRAGARGPSVRALQSFLIAQGLQVGRTGADGSWGDLTTKAVKAWQSSHGINPDGVVGKDTLTAMDKVPQVQAPPPGAAAPTTAPAAQTTPRTPTPPASGPATPAQAQGGNRPAAGAPGSRNGGLPDDFQKMWDAHPHNYQEDGTPNTASDDLQVQQGWSPDAYSNTCAIRLSIMFNKLGGDFAITRPKAKAAGIDPGRIPYSKKTGWYYILSAKEMWTYVSHHCGKPSVEFPARGRFKDGAAFDEAFSSEIEPALAGKKGIVAFDKIFTFSGTGHVDIFEGTKLSDASNWYPSQALKLWYV